MDWSKASPEMIARVVDEGTAYSEGQLTLATSADQRASVLAGVFTAAGTAILAGLIALGAVSDIPHRVSFPIYLGGGFSVLLFLIAAAFCIAATLPVGFWLSGNEPQSWFRDVEAGKALPVAFGEEAEHIQDKIAENRQIIAANARRFKWGAALGIAAPIVGMLFWLVSSSSLWAAA
jgi:hypothetical protein